MCLWRNRHDLNSEEPRSHARALNACMHVLCCVCLVKFSGIVLFFAILCAFATRNDGGVRHMGGQMAGRLWLSPAPMISICLCCWAGVVQMHAVLHAAANK